MVYNSHPIRATFEILDFWEIFFMAVSKLLKMINGHLKVKIRYTE